MNFVTSNVANGNYLILNSELYELNSTVTHSLANNVYGEYYSYTYNKRFNESTVIVTANIIYSIAGWGADTFKSRLKLVTNSITTYSLENNQKFEFIDTLIFTSTCSSSFGAALCTNKKIILLFNENMYLMIILTVYFVIATPFWFCWFYYSKK